MISSLGNVLIYAGVVLLALVIIGVILTRLYRRATKDVALIRTGFGGEKVVLIINRKDKTIGFSPWKVCTPKFNVNG